MKNHMTLEFPAISQNESFARTAAGAFFAQLDPTMAELADVRTAISEAVTNAIIHAYEHKADERKVRLEVRIEGNEATFVVEDFGKGITDIEKAREPFYTTDAARERSGMGFSVMEAFMDSLYVESCMGAGTRITMTKRAGGNA